MFGGDLVDIVGRTAYGLFPGQGLKGHLGLKLRGVITSYLAYRISAPCCVTVGPDIHLS